MGNNDGFLPLKRGQLEARQRLLYIAMSQLRSAQLPADQSPDCQRQHPGGVDYVAAADEAFGGGDEKRV